MPFPHASDLSPAPWFLAEATSTIPIKDAHGRTVASVKYRANDLVDATAMMAAPVMLAALKDLVDPAVEADPQRSHAAKRAARAAIALAELA